MTAKADRNAEKIGAVRSMRAGAEGIARKEAP